MKTKLPPLLLETEVEAFEDPDVYGLQSCVVMVSREEDLLDTLRRAAWLVLALSEWHGRDGWLCH